jgi:hypothetical protein
MQVGVDAPPNARIPLTAFDEEIHPGWPLSKIKAENDEPWIHNELVRVGPLPSAAASKRSAMPFAGTSRYFAAMQ